MCGNGHVIPGTPIAVDLWNTKSCPQARLFFLSHFHQDHVVGLSSSWEYPIYTSEITGKLIVKIIGINSALVKVLAIGEDHLISLDTEGEEMVTVKLFDANHCPGSVMFLFQGYFGNILYTGDFRCNVDLLNSLSLPVIDVLYLDNTYCSPKCIFYNQEDAMEAVLQKLHNCLRKSCRVFLGLDNLGKEDLLMKVAKETHSKICMNCKRMEILEILGLSDIATTDEKASKVFVIPTGHISGQNVERWNKEMRTCAILATARFCGFNFKPYSQYPNIHVIPYSNHSSYAELQTFVKHVHPRTIIPIISKHVKGMFGIDISERADMNVFHDFMEGSPCTEYVIPKTVQKAMNLWTANSGTTLPRKRRKVVRKLPTPLKLHRVHKGVTFHCDEESYDSTENSSDEDKILNSNEHYVWEVVHNAGHRKCKIWHISEESI